MPNRNNNQLQEGIRSAQSQAGYGVSLIPYHTHDGVNSPHINGVNVYFGSVAAGGGANFSLPLKWSAVRASTGQYTVNHNLNTTKYAVTVSALGLNPIAANVNLITATSFQVDIGAPTDSDFNFIVAVIQQ